MRWNYPLYRVEWWGVSGCGRNGKLGYLMGEIRLD